MRRKYDEGGILVGPSHAEGGIPFTVNGSGQKIEVEGREAVISSAAFQDDKIYTYRGTNWDILDQINQKYGGNSLYEQVESIGVGDFIICISSVEDPTVRQISGTNEEVISAINESGGCVSTKKGAEVVEILKKRRKKMKYGGWVDSAEWEVRDSNLFKCLLTVRGIVDANAKVIDGYIDTHNNVYVVEYEEAKPFFEGMVKETIASLTECREYLNTDKVRVGKQFVFVPIADGVKISGGKIDKERDELYQKWRNLVNMSASELEAFYKSEDGKKAGLTAKQARAQGIGSGRQSARWILRMKRTPKSEWTDEMWRWAGRQVSFISRMSGNEGSLYDDKGQKTRKHLSLLIWGHNPNKKKAGGTISQTPAPKKDRIKGSKVNPKESASSGKSGASIELSEETIKSIRSIIDEHNDEYPNKKITLSVAKAVVRRGMGAYSSSHRPTISGGKPNSRVAWGLARLNAFVFKAQKGYSKSGKYSQDNDLLDELGIKHQKFEEGGSVLLAPNGKPSNLTPEQYKLVRTPEFKAWFGDWENSPETASKVVDENGEPLVVYHGTFRKFNVFEISKDGGFYFTEFKRIAEIYATSVQEGKTTKKPNENPIVLTCFLNLKKILTENVYGIVGKNIARINKAKNKRCDGLIIKGGRDIGGYYNQIIAFYPNQIKLADGTNTTFDGSNPDIRYEGGGEILMGGNLNKGDYAFMDWFIGWYEPISDDLNITFSFPNELQPFAERDVVVLDLFEKINQEIDAKPFLKQITKKADEFGVTIYLEPMPRYKYFLKNIEKRKKIGKEYLISYYEKFGFQLTKDGRFMKRIPNPDIRFEMGGIYHGSPYRFEKFEQGGGDILPGGKAEGMDISDIAKHHGMGLSEILPQYIKGIKHEMEHTSDKDVASEIAKDHIYERADYYEMLEQMEQREDDERDWSTYYESGGHVGLPPERFLDEDGERKTDRKTIEELTAYVNSLPQTKSFYFDEATNTYGESRRKVHAEIINKYKKDLICIEREQPIAILMGGSPASGKSTFVKKYSPYLLSSEIFKIDADDIRSQLPEYQGWNASQTHLETKDIVNTLISDRNIGIPCKFDIIYDGTMNSVKSYLPLIDTLKKEGYRIFIVYIDKVPKDVITERALNRYKKSGRFVPLEVIDDFFEKGRSAFDSLKSEVDGYMVVDGSNQDYNIIEKGGMELPRERNYNMLGKKIKTLDIPQEYGRGGSIGQTISFQRGKLSTEQKEQAFLKEYGVSWFDVYREYQNGLLKNWGNNHALVSSLVSFDISRAYNDWVEIWAEKEIPSKLWKKKDLFVPEFESEIIINTPKLRSVTETTPARGKKYNTRDLTDKIEILSSLVGDATTFRKSLSGVYIDIDDGRSNLVASDAWAMAVIPFDRKDYGGEKSKIVNPDTGQPISSEKYPNYLAVIPENDIVVPNINVYELLRDTEPVERLNKFFYTSPSILIGFEVKGEVYKYNPELWNKLLIALARLKYDRVDLKFSTPNRAVTISPAGSNEVIGLVMPIFSSGKSYVPILIEAIANTQPESPKPQRKPRAKREPQARPQTPTTQQPATEPITYYGLNTPTGKPTKLTYLQQLLVRTDAFKRFFGDWEDAANKYLSDGEKNFMQHYKDVSKVIDFETLEPRVLYHGTMSDKEFFEFDVSKTKTVGRPYGYFAHNIEYSQNFTQTSQTGRGNIPILYQVFLNVRNPFMARGDEFDLRKERSDYWLQAIKNRIAYDETGQTNADASLSKTVDSQIKPYAEKIFTGFEPFWLFMARDTNKQFKSFLLSYHYDGIDYTENFTDPYDQFDPRQFTKAVAIFDANQVKLADGRNWNFDSAYRDMRMEHGGTVPNEHKNMENDHKNTENAHKSRFDIIREKIAGEYKEDETPKVLAVGGQIEELEVEKNEYQIYVENLINITNKDGKD